MVNHSEEIPAPEGRPRPNKDIVVIGGSSGSGAVLRTLLSDLPGDLPASILVATHRASQSAGSWGEMLAGRSALPVAEAVDWQALERGRVYVAAPDRHLLILDNVVRLGDGPRENMARPAVDALFRSAALSFGTRVIGVVLSGLLNDGAAGLGAIKSCGGTAVVQHPLDAEAEGMPLAALEAAEVDHIASGKDLGGLIDRLVRTEAGPSLHQPSENLRLEVEIAAGARLGSARLRRLAEPSALSCPDCGGVLSEMRGSRPLRYRCQIGHAYTAEVLAMHSDLVDEALRVAMRIMEERVTLVERMAADAREEGRQAVADLYGARAEEYRGYAATLREAALSMLRFGSPGRGPAP